MGTLPADFVFGVSTASYQIEGGVSEDGRGRSVWDDFCDRPGVIADGSSGAVACDSFHRSGDDIAAMAELGIAAYRFSVAWPRVLPQGRGQVNQAGLDYYDRLVDGLLAHGIRPCPTLFHWDLPSPLEAAEGWLERDTALAFGEYAAVVADRLADRADMWFPINEPNVATYLGYGTGAHAPGRALGLGALPVAHHLLLGHGLAVAALRAAGAASIGCANHHSPVWAASESPEDQAAAAFCDATFNRLFAEPILLGAYPEGLGDLLPGPVAEDLRLIGAPLDFYGINYYNPVLAAATPGPGEAAESTGLPTSSGGSRATRGPTLIGPWCRMACGSWSFTSRGGMASTSPRSTSPRTAAPTTPVRTPSVASPTVGGSTTWLVTSTGSEMPSTRAPTSGATSSGRYWTTSSGPMATPSVSA